MHEHMEQCTADIYGKLGGRGTSGDVRNKDQGQVAGKRF
jgi:hypothetical protein